MKPIKKSYTGLCADSTSCFPTWQKRPLKLRWIKESILYKGFTNEGEIICTPVYFATDEHKTAYIMDVITGTCYLNNKCCTSDHLELYSYAPAPGLDKKLMSMRLSKAIGA